MINELNGYDKVIRGTLYRNVIHGIRRELQAAEKCAQPITRQLLYMICNFVGINVVWIQLIFTEK